MFKKNELWYWMFLSVYLYSRKWPYGDWIQTVADVALTLATVLVIVKIFFLKSTKK